MFLELQGKVRAVLLVTRGVTGETEAVMAGVQ